MTWLTRHYGELLAQRAFMRFWIARLKGVMANQMLMVAVGWHMYDLTGSPWDLGLVGLFQFVPALVMTLPAGHIADRHHRARIFAATTATQGLVAAALMWGTLTGQVSREMILGLSVLLGLARAFQMPAQQALPPLLVPRELLPRAIALGSSGMEIAIISGPALGGVLYTHGATLVYGTCVALLTLSTMLALAVHYTRSVHRASMTWASLFSGLRFVRQQKVVLGATTLDLFAVLLGGATALLPMFARDILHTDASGLGLLRAAPAVGALTMSVVLTRWPLQRQVGRRLLLSVGAFGLATVVFGLSESFWLSMVALAATGAADNISVVTRLTLTQLETPDDMRGRVAAVNSIFIGASNQLGEFESGATAALWGPVGSVVAGGVGAMLVAVAWTRLFPELAQRDHMAPAATPVSGLGAPSA
ncbi:MFS transporter [uncultured Aquabacterium sp.]|uniref:MFS transporter n=1 Tax=Aquabacterium sp. TaxID=1872578 RepID=UPI0025EA81D9|nr:MFS transporter [uncultured Aquabacterium sp.]